jgi:hypothetical protein
MTGTLSQEEREENRDELALPAMVAFGWKAGSFVSR